jgi:hypothetical protein
MKRAVSVIEIAVVFKLQNKNLSVHNLLRFNARIRVSFAGRN